MCIRDRNLYLRPSRPDLPARFNTGPVREPNIHHHHIRRVVSDPPDGLFDRPGLTNHFEAFLAPEQSDEALSHDLVVIDDQNPHCTLIFTPKATGYSPQSQPARELPVPSDQ